MYKNNASWFKNRYKSTIKKWNMQENVRFFDTKLHKNAYFSVCKVHKIAKSVISIGQKDYVKKSQTNIKCARKVQKCAKCANCATDRRAGDDRHKTEKDN